MTLPLPDAPPRLPAALPGLRSRAFEALNRLRANEELAPELAAQLLRLLDEECRGRLSAGRDEVYGSIASLRSPFQQFLQVNARALELSDADLADGALQAELFGGFLARLRDDGDLVFITDRQRARSRAFETVHYLRNLRQRTAHTERNGLQPARLVESVKVEVKRRERPDRTRASVATFLDRLDDLAGRLRLPADPGWAADAEAEILRDVFERFLGAAFGRQAGFGLFQVAAWRELLEAGLGASRGGAFVVAAGTGFGKTEAFLFPVLFYSALAQVARQQGGRFREGTDALLLYPRRDLCDNQAERVLGYLFHLNRELRQEYGANFPPLRVAVAHSGVFGSFRVRCPACEAERRGGGRWGPEDEQRAVIEADFDAGQFRRFVCRRADRDEHQRAADMLVFQVLKSSGSAQLVITTIDTLHRRLMDDHGNRRLFGRGVMPPRFVVVDELHIYEGQVGAHAANVLRRCRQRVVAMSADGTGPVFVGASATAGRPSRLAADAFGVPENQVRVLTPGPDESLPLGLEYFMFVQSPGNRLLLDEPDDEPDGDGRAANTRFVTEQASMIQAAFCLQHTMKSPAGAGVRKRRVLGFVDSIDVAQRLATNLDDADWQRMWPPRAAPYTLLPLYAYRYPIGRPDCSPNERRELPLATALRAALRDAAQVTRPDTVPVAERATFALPQVGNDCPRAAAGNCHQPPHHVLDTCHRYESGECWFTLGLPGEEGLRPAPIQNHRAGGHRAWGNRSRRFDDPQRDAWRLLISTSALEVGFDHAELIATWQYHAPPSLAAFVQRKGRGGRGPRDYPVTMLVLGASESDRYAFRNHLRLVEVASRDLVTTMDPANPSVRAGHVVAAIFDYLAADSGSNVFYQLELDRVLELVANPPTGLSRWLQGCFGPTLSPSDLEDLLRRFDDQIRGLWHAPLRVPEFEEDGGELRPRDLFLRCDADRVTRYHDRVVRALATPNADLVARAARERAQAWLEQAHLYHEEQRDRAGRGRFSVVEFCRFLPAALNADPDLRLPNTTIPVPLGRHVQIYAANPQRAGTRPLAQEAAEFALAVFLPGGFRIRYDGHLWMAPWQAVRPRPTGPHQTWVATRGQLHATDRPGDTLAQQLETDTDWPQAQQEEWLGRVGEDCGLAIVTGLNVYDMGDGVNRKFQLHRHELAMVPARPVGANPADWIELQRDPHLTTRSFLIARRSPGSQAISIPAHRLVRRVRFQPALRLTLVHYANLVHCYPSEDETRTIVLRFWDERQNRPLCPAIELRSQGVEFRLTDPDPTAWDRPTAARAFWHRVRTEVVERLLVQAGVLQNAYLLDPLVESLRWLEASNSPVGGWLDALPTEGELAEEAHLLLLRPVARGHNRPLQFVAEHAPAVRGVLAAARDWVLHFGQAATQARSLAAAMKRAAADLLGVSPDAFRQLSEPTTEGWRVVLFDALDGGNGNARRLADEIRRDPNRLFGPALAAAVACPAVALDRAVETALGSDHTPDLLAVLATEGRFPAEWLPAEAEAAGRTRGHLRRLFETPALAAFNQYAFGELITLRARLGGEPPAPLLLDQVHRTPALDSRAEALRLRFLAEDTGVSQLPARLRQLTPLCLAGCPECVGSDDPDTTGDRPLLERLLNPV